MTARSRIFDPTIYIEETIWTVGYQRSRTYLTARPTLAAYASILVVAFVASFSTHTVDNDSRTCAGSALSRTVTSAAVLRALHALAAHLVFARKTLDDTGFTSSVQVVALPASRATIRLSLHTAPASRNTLVADSSVVVGCDLANRHTLKYVELYLVDSFTCLASEPFWRHSCD